MNCDTVKALVDSAFEHIDGCDGCQVGAPLKDMCEMGQRLLLVAVNQLVHLDGELVAMPASIAVDFEKNVRENVAAELVTAADRMEVAHPGKTSVARDAHWVRQAARIARFGPPPGLMDALDDEEAAEHLDEISRLREAAEEESVLRQVAEDFADTLAQAVLPHLAADDNGEGRPHPWGLALDVITPAAEVTALRAELLEAREGGPTCPGAVWWTAERAAKVRDHVNRIGTLPDQMSVEEHDRWVCEVAADVALSLQLRVDILERYAAFLTGELEAIRDEQTAYLLESRLKDSTGPWERTGLHWSWQDRGKAQDKLVAARDRQPEREHRMITRTTSVTETVTDLACDGAVYVYNARSVNRHVKHIRDAQAARVRLTLCDFQASAPMLPSAADALPLCGGCRRELEARQDAWDALPDRTGDCPGTSDVGKGIDGARVHTGCCKPTAAVPVGRQTATG